MIELSTPDPNDISLAHLAEEYRPTHAVAASVNVATMPGTYRFTATYWFGKIVDGEFVHLIHIPVCIVDIPNMQNMGISRVHADKILDNLFGRGTAPSPQDPTVPIMLHGKEQGDFKMQDIDAICCVVETRLKGTIYDS